jgi:hypothetical protein
MDGGGPELQAIGTDQPHGAGNHRHSLQSAA